MSTNTVTMTSEEAEALLEAAKYGLSNKSWTGYIGERDTLSRAIRKLRYADVLLLDGYDNDPAACEGCGNTLNDGSDICDQCGGDFK